jgi:hypothetical protein
VLQLTLRGARQHVVAFVATVSQTQHDHHHNNNNNERRRHRMNPLCLRTLVSNMMMVAAHCAKKLCKGPQLLQAQVMTSNANTTRTSMVSKARKQRVPEH